MTQTQKDRLEELKTQRRKWWKDEVPRSKKRGWTDFVAKTPGDKPVSSYCAMKDFSVVSVEVWVDSSNCKIVSPIKDTAAGRVWPTKEGAYLYLLEKAFGRRKDLLDDLEAIDVNIRSIDNELLIIGC